MEGIIGDVLVNTFHLHTVKIWCCWDDGDKNATAAAAAELESVAQHTRRLAVCLHIGAADRGAISVSLQLRRTAHRGGSIAASIWVYDDVIPASPTSHCLRRRAWRHRCLMLPVLSIRRVARGWHVKSSRRLKQDARPKGTAGSPEHLSWHHRHSLRRNP